jgi:hypothetical protein
MPRSVPSLPPSFVEELLAGGILADEHSICLSAKFISARRDIVHGGSPDGISVTIAGLHPPEDGPARKTRFMTVAISQFDALTVCELIRLNANPDRVDADGRTPLMHAAEQLASLRDLGESPALLQAFNYVSGLANGAAMDPDEIGRSSERLRFIIKTLVCESQSLSSDVAPID